MITPLQPRRSSPLAALALLAIAACVYASLPGRSSVPAPALAPSGEVDLDGAAEPSATLVSGGSESRRTAAPSDSGAESCRTEAERAPAAEDSAPPGNGRLLGRILPPPGGKLPADIALDLVRHHSRVGGWRRAIPVRPDGRFDASGLDATGTYSLEVDGTDVVAHALPRLRLDPDDPTEVDIHLRRGAIFRAFVLGADGQPLDSFEAHLEPLEVEATPRPGPRQARVQNAAGELAVAGLVHGKWLVEFRAEGALARRVRCELPMGPAPVRIRLPGVVPLHGRVVDPDGRPVQDAWVSAAPVDPPSKSEDCLTATEVAVYSRTDVNGRFELATAAGAVEVTARASGFAGSAPIERRGAVGLAPETALTLQLRRLGEVRGRATTRGTTRVHLRASTGGETWNTWTTPTGEFVLSGIPPGEYRAAFSSSRGARPSTPEPELVFDRRVVVPEGGAAELVVQ